MKNIVKIKIGQNQTKIKYSKKTFPNRMNAIKASIFTLKRILEMYGNDEK